MKAGVRAWAFAVGGAMVLIVGLAARAQDATELRVRAEKEIRQTGKVQSRSSDAQVSESMLQLKDPLPEPEKRGWDYFVSLSVQSFTPSGSGGNDLTPTRFEMKEAGSTIMPSVAAGMQFGVVRRETWSLGLGVGAHLGYSTEKNPARFATGFTSPGTLNTTIMSADPMLSLRFTRMSKWALNLGAQFGTLNYTQSSVNKLATFSERAEFYGQSVGIDYSVFPQWSVFTDFVHRQLATVSKIGLQPDNYELGTRITW